MKTDNSPGKLDIETSNLKSAALYFRAINHVLRQKMLQLLHQKRRMAVNEIYVKIKMPQPVTSQHLALLRRAHLVYTERVGRSIFYSVNYQQMETLHQIASQLIKTE